MLVIGILLAILAAVIGLMSLFSGKKGASIVAGCIVLVGILSIIKAVSEGDQGRKEAEKQAQERTLQNDERARANQERTLSGQRYEEMKALVGKATKLSAVVTETSSARSSPNVVIRVKIEAKPGSFFGIPAILHPNKQIYLPTVDFEDLGRSKFEVPREEDAWGTILIMRDPLFGGNLETDIRLNEDQNLKLTLNK
jgi:hypothetical protein